MLFFFWFVSRCIGQTYDASICPMKNSRVHPCIVAASVPVVRNPEHCILKMPSNLYTIG